jgi:hypothetical protein
MADGIAAAVHTLVVHRAGAISERRVVEAPLRAGGSNADDLHLPGTPPAALRLEPAEAGVVVEALTTGVRVGGRPVAPGTRRLLRPGERAEVHHVELALAPEEPRSDSTRAAAATLLRDAAAGAGPIAATHLVVLTGPEAGACHALGADQTLGRGPAATIRIADPHASRVHARLRLERGGATIEDLSSKNGLRVNGVRIDRERWALAPGDELALGETSFALHDLATGTAPVPAGPRPSGTPPPVRAAPPLLAAALLALSAVALALASR